MENRNLLLVLVLSFGFLFGWQYFVTGPMQEKEQARIEALKAAETAQKAEEVKAAENAAAPNATPSDNLPTATSNQTPVQAQVDVNALSVEDALAKGLRLNIETARVTGSINLQGGRLDDIHLKDYKVEQYGEATVSVFTPSSSGSAYYADFGWAPKGTIEVPNRQTIWSAEKGATLTETTPVVLTWDNGQGLTFIREYAIDANYLVTVKQTIKNNGSGTVALHPYGLIARHGTPKTTGIYILHEGPIGVLGEDGLQELAYSDLTDDGEQKFTATKGWLGFTDHYFASALIPNQAEAYTGRFTSFGALKNNYQTDYLLDAQNVAAGTEVSVTNHLFVGAKENQIIQKYSDENGFEKFDLMIDWGIFYFITKPLFWLLNFFNDYIGNFGFAILAVTVVVKAIFFPLANKSYASMGKMKKLQPKIEAIKERFGDDRMRLQQAQMELFREEKVNPLAGCWPMLLQIPVFFALYKVLYIAIEMRHAPFWGWIQDLSMPDPTSIFNLFGLLPYDLPTFLIIGVWPILMGITQFIQMRLNPAPTDKVQAMVFGWMPVFFTFLLASFPAGMVIYWTWSNFLGIIQQAYIMRKNDVEIALFDNIKNMFGSKTKDV